MIGARAFFDTNVLVYLFDEDSPAKRERALQIFAEHAHAGEIVLSPQVLQEFYVTVTRKLARPLARDKALEATLNFEAFTSVAIDGKVVLRAIQLHQRATLSFWDALIVQAALEGNCKTLISEDLQHGRAFGDLVVENPFASPGR